LNNNDNYESMMKSEFGRVPYLSNNNSVAMSNGSDNESLKSIGRSGYRDY
jgi:hypothetical protein